jgi:hypothetical protein
LGFCLALPIKKEYVSMQDLGIKSLLHLDQVEVTVVHGHLEQCCRIASIGERNYRLLNGSFNLNLHSIAETLTNGLGKKCLFREFKKDHRVGVGWHPNFDLSLG